MSVNLASDEATRRSTRPEHYRISDGRMVPIDPAPAGGWDQEEMSAANYYLGHELGALESVRIWESRDSRPAEYQFAVDCCPCNGNVFRIWCRDAADFVAAMGLLHPIILANSIDDKLEDLTKAITKIFRAHHGHGVNGCCPECDPAEWKRRQEWIQQREHERKGRTS